MSDELKRFRVITGGPGSGKTTLVNALRGAGFAATDEAGRGIIQDQVAMGGRALPWLDPALFAELMMAWELRSYHQARRETGTVFFDRGVPDVIGYLQLQGLPIPAYMDRAARLFRYHRQVFIAPPWQDIFATDRERKQDFAEAVRTYGQMVQTYASYGYELVEIPRGTVDERFAFVTAHPQAAR